MHPLIKKYQNGDDDDDDDGGERGRRKVKRFAFFLVDLSTGRQVTMSTRQRVIPFENLCSTILTLLR